jgi:type II secretory pathway pseudopilin PulG
LPFRRRSAAPGVGRLQKGFTLVEAVISAGLLGFLAVTATYFWVDTFSLARTVNADSAAIADGRASLERLAREIREVKYDNASGAYCVTTMAATQMVFTKTSGTYNPTCGTNDFAVTVQSSTPNLNLTYAGAAAAPLTSFASSFGIRYLDASYAVTTSAIALRFVELSLTVQPPAQQGNQAGQTTQTRTVVALRNQ